MLIVALSRVPISSRPATARAMSAPRALKPPLNTSLLPSSAKVEAIHLGSTGMVTNSAAWPAQPAATAPQTTVYSRIRLQPTIQARPSPSTE